MATEDRKAVHAYLSIDAHDVLQDYADANGVSVTSLIETLALQLDKEIADAGDPMDVRQDWVRDARKVDAERRRRGGTR